MAPVAQLYFHHWVQQENVSSPDGLNKRIVLGHVFVSKTMESAYFLRKAQWTCTTELGSEPEMLVPWVGTQDTVTRRSRVDIERQVQQVCPSQEGRANPREKENGP